MPRIPAAKCDIHTHTHTDGHVRNCSSLYPRPRPLTGGGDHNAVKLTAVFMGLIQSIRSNHFIIINILNVHFIIVLCLLHYVSKKLHPFYFCNNFLIRELIFIIFDNNMRKKICNKMYIVFPTTPNLYAPTHLVTRAASLTNIHIVAVVSSCASRFFRAIN